MTTRLLDPKTASRYAKALLDLAVENNQTDTVLADLASLETLFANVPGLHSFLESPAVSLDEKLQLLSGSQFAGLLPTVRQLLRLLAENGRLASFSLLVTQFREAMNRRAHVAQADVVSAVALDAAALDQLRAALEKTFAYTRVDIHHRVDPGILGGAIVRIGDRFIDGSYIGRLEQLRHQLGA